MSSKNRKSAPRSGRAKGSKNLKRAANGQRVNQHGVSFSDADKAKLENLVNKANYRRKKMLKEAATLPRMAGGKETGDTVGSLQLMGKESDFILARKTKSLQRFKSRDQFDQYLKQLERVNSPEYLDERTRDYKRNYSAALDNVFGDEAKDVKMKIRMMKPEEYRKIVEQDEDLEISYIYDVSERTAKLNKIRRALGMKEKEEEYDDY